MSRRMLLGACALMSAFAVAAPAQARIINTTFDFDTETANCVTGETVLYTETFHIVARTEIVDGEEQAVEFLRFDTREGKGVGVESGDHYEINNVSIQRDAANPLTLNAVIHVIDTGSGADFFVSEVFHTTTNANGEVSVWHTAANVRCGDFHEHVGVRL